MTTATLALVGALLQPVAEFGPADVGVLMAMVLPGERCNGASCEARYYVTHSMILGVREDVTLDRIAPRPEGYESGCINCDLNSDGVYGDCSAESVPCSANY